MRRQDAAWTRQVVEVLKQPCGSMQLQSLARWLQCLSVVDHFVLFVYDGDQKPLLLFHTLSENLKRIFIDWYKDGPYLQSPFYLACRKSQTNGLCCLREMASDEFHDSEYFRSYYSYLGLNDELGFFVNLQPKCTAVFSLMKRLGRGSFRSDEIALLNNALPVVDAVVQAAWHEHRRIGGVSASENDKKVTETFECFGRGLITQREREVAKLLLRGHSSLAISQLLNISNGTVKVHRRNLYEKLGVRSQSDLLGLFIRCLESI
ncbi:response regulator transcription factor [Pseudomonas chlororaphis]|uniref:response regulator transcription factor n=1 Tax=Pseudomonas chlororaphis TaxID=587753 RepID=UPI0009B87C25|nr:helix-turn-helix transcriptional regulator [Pseudomonas chlororaphis]